MIPLRDNIKREGTPVLVWTLIGLNVVIYLWDRNWALTGPNLGLADLAMRPKDVTLALTQNGDPTAMAKIVTSMFLHGSLAHLIGNMLFMFAFGPGVESVLKAPRFALFYLFWGLFAAATHVWVDPTSDVPTVGASGAIGGVLGTYFLLFPGSQIKGFVPPFFFLPFSVPSWALLGIWFVWQILFPQPGVANWAHAGGFLAGMLTVLVLGGRTKALAGQKFEEDEYFDD